MFHVERSHDLVDGRRQLVYELFEVRRLDRVRRCNQHVVALATVDRPAHRVANQPVREGLALQARMKAATRIERRLGAAIRDELQGPKEAAAANIADMLMVFKSLLE